MENIYTNIINTLKRKINILIIDDDMLYLNTMETMFSSPLFNVTKVLNQKHANQETSKANRCWHCWILEVAIGKNQGGLNILKSNRHFPFKIVFSGLKSMTIASMAMQTGAINVFDKGPGCKQLFYEEVCKTAALGFILKGKQTQYIPQFLLLKNLFLDNYREWAQKACVSIRHLERICSDCSNLTPKYLISLFYSVYYLLRGEEKNGWDKNTKDFFFSKLLFVNKNIEKYKQKLCA